MGPGQLYAHHRSPSQAELLTRGQAGMGGVTVGLGTVASGTYVCEAGNFEETQSVTLKIAVESGQLS